MSTLMRRGKGKVRGRRAGGGRGALAARVHSGRSAETQWQVEGIGGETQ